MVTPIRALDEWLAEWEKAYPMDVFGEATARQVKNGERSTDSFAATIHRSVLAKVREQIRVIEDTQW